MNDGVRITELDAMSAQMAGQKAKYTLLGGYMDAGATLAGGGYKYMRSV